MWVRVAGHARAILFDYRSRSPASEVVAPAPRGSARGDPKRMAITPATIRLAKHYGLVHCGLRIACIPVASSSRPLKRCTEERSRRARPPPRGGTADIDELYKNRTPESSALSDAERRHGSAPRRSHPPTRITLCVGNRARAADAALRKTRRSARLSAPAGIQANPNEDRRWQAFRHRHQSRECLDPPLRLGAT